MLNKNSYNPIDYDSKLYKICSQDKIDINKLEEVIGHCSEFAIMTVYKILAIKSKLNTELISFFKTIKNGKSLILNALFSDKKFITYCQNQELKMSYMKIAINWRSKRVINDALVCTIMNPSANINLFQLFISKGADINYNFDIVIENNQTSVDFLSLIAYTDDKEYNIREKAKFFIKNGIDVDSFIIVERSNVSSEIEKLVINVKKENLNLIKAIKENDTHKAKIAFDNGAQLSAKFDKNAIKQAIPNAICTVFEGNNYNMQRVFTDKLTKVCPQFGDQVCAFMLILKRNNSEVKLPKAIIFKIISSIEITHSGLFPALN